MARGFRATCHGVQLSEREVLGKETLLQRLAEQLGHVTDLQPPHQVKPMHLNRSHADIQTAGNVAVRVPLRHQFKNFLLPGRESFSALRAPWRSLGQFHRLAFFGCGSSFGGLRGLFGLRSFA